MSTQDNAKLFQQLESGFKKTINWNKYQSKVTGQEQNRFLDYLADPCFPGINKLFVLSSENKTRRARYTRYYLPRVEIKD